MSVVLSGGRPDPLSGLRGRGGGRRRDAQWGLRQAGLQAVGVRSVAVVAVAVAAADTHASFQFASIARAGPAPPVHLGVAWPCRQEKGQQRQQPARSAAAAAPLAAAATWACHGAL